MWPFGDLSRYLPVLRDLPFAQKAVSAAVALGVLVLAAGGTIGEAQVAMQASAVVSVAIALARGEP